MLGEQEVLEQKWRDGQRGQQECFFPTGQREDKEKDEKIRDKAFAPGLRGTQGSAVTRVLAAGPSRRLAVLPASSAAPQQTNQPTQLVTSLLTFLKRNELIKFIFPRARL